MPVFGDFLVRIFPHLDWIRKDTPYLSEFSPMQKNADQKKSDYGHFLRCVAKHINEVLQIFFLNMNINYISLLVIIEFLISF